MYFIDIETVPAFRSLREADQRTQELFIKKHRFEIAERVEKLANKISGGGTLVPHGILRLTSEVEEQVYLEKAGVLAEFNRIVCVSMGCYLAPTIDKPEQELYIKSFVGEEREILTTLSEALRRADGLCAHFGKGFDFPVLGRKYLIHRLPIPHLLKTQGLKPWEIQLVDTQELWKFGDLRHSVSLDLLTHIFGIPSPKKSMDGSQVAEYFYDGRIKEIAEYCEEDVKALAAVYQFIK